MMRSSSHYRSLVSLLSNILDAHTVAFFISVPKKQQLRLVASQSLSKHLREHSVLPMEDGGLLAQVLRTGQTIHLEKLGSQEIETALPFYREGESLIKALFIAPVGDGAGVLFVDTKYSWGFNDKQRKWIAEVAVLLNQLMDHNQTLLREQTYARILALWHGLDEAAFSETRPEVFLRAVVNECTRFLDVDHGFLVASEPGGENYRVLATGSNASHAIPERSFPCSQGLIGWVLYHQKNLLIRRLRSDAKEHFLFFPQEKLPHQGTFWGVHSEIAMGQGLALVFLSRQLREWHGDDQYAIEKVTRFTNLFLEWVHLGEACSHLRSCDVSTSLYNPATFEAILDEQIGESLSRSQPFSLALLQFEPWEQLYTRFTPQRLRSYQQELVQGIHQMLPAEVLSGQLAENRLALLFKRTGLKEVEAFLHRVSGKWLKGAPEIAGKLRLSLRLGAVTYPTDGDTGDQLWAAAYQRLYADEPVHHGGSAAPRPAKTIDPNRVSR
jgi:GGDEF domain-containing protein